MRRRRDRELERRLRDVPAPDETGAEERAWDVVRAAYAEHTPARRAHRVRRLALAVAAAVAALAVGLSPAGARVADLVTDVVSIGTDDAEPALTRLPAAGELLVTSPQGPWIVREDGSKRLLGGYEDAEATWSLPRSLHVAVADGDDLIVVDPSGELRWSLARPPRVSDPRWSPSGVRIAYRSGSDLRVVAGDGTGDGRLARNVPPVAPAWHPAPTSKLQRRPGSGTHVLAYASSRSTVTVADADRGRALERLAIPGGGPIDEIEFTADGSLLLVRTGDALLAFEPEARRLTWRSRMATSAAALSPDGRQVAAISEPDEPNGESRLVVINARTGSERRLPAGLGQFSDVAWSPDGRWVLLAWRAADQWLFLRLDPDRPRRVVAVGDISSQFAPGAGGAAFPGIAGWALPDRP